MQPKTTLRFLVNRLTIVEITFDGAVVTPESIDALIEILRVQRKAFEVTKDGS